MSDIKCVTCDRKIQGGALVSGDDVFHAACASPTRVKNPWPCPACKTRGGIENRERPIKATREVPNDYMTSPCDPRTRTEEYVTGYETDECNLCRGVGWLPSEPVPVVKRTGWKLR